VTELTQQLAAQVHALTAAVRQRLAELRHDERGNFTIEQALWAVAAIAFVTLVVAAITVFLNDQISLLR
jgi:Flp pilus assembly protein TadG